MDERKDLLKQNGINEKTDPLLNNYWEAAWPQSDIYLHKSMSLHLINYNASRLIGELISLEYDPFNADIQLDTRL